MKLICLLKMQMLLWIKGTNDVHNELSKGYQTVEKTVDMASSVVKAINAVAIKAENGVPRIALLTPYIDSVHKMNVQYLTATIYESQVFY